MPDASVDCEPDVGLQHEIKDDVQLESASNLQANEQHQPACAVSKPVTTGSMADKPPKRNSGFFKRLLGFTCIVPKPSAQDEVVATPQRNNTVVVCTATTLKASCYSETDGTSHPSTPGASSSAPSSASPHAPRSCGSSSAGGNGEQDNSIEKLREALEEEAEAGDFEDCCSVSPSPSMASSSADTNNGEPISAFARQALRDQMDLPEVCMPTNQSPTTPPLRSHSTSPVSSSVPKSRITRYSSLGRTSASMTREPTSSLSRFHTLAASPAHYGRADRQIDRFLSAQQYGGRSVLGMLGTVERNPSKFWDPVRVPLTTDADDSLAKPKAHGTRSLQAQSAAAPLGAGAHKDAPVRTLLEAPRWMGTGPSDRQRPTQDFAMLLNAGMQSLARTRSGLSRHNSLGGLGQPTMSMHMSTSRTYVHRFAQPELYNARPTSTTTGVGVPLDALQAHYGGQLRLSSPRVAASLLDTM